MQMATEARLIKSIIFGGLGIFALMLTDRREPVEQIENVALGPVSAGSEVLIRSKVIRRRTCQTHFERMAFDALNVRTIMLPLDFVKVGANAPDSFVNAIPIPSTAHPGEGFVRFIISWECWPASTFWPVVRIIDVPITILPKE
jgi:hypothetical protein